MSAADRIRNAIEAIHYPRVGIDMDGEQYVSCANCAMDEEGWPCRTMAAFESAVADPGFASRDTNELAEMDDRISRAMNEAADRGRREQAARVVEALRIWPCSTTQRPEMGCAGRSHPRAWCPPCRVRAVLAPPLISTQELE